MIILVYSPIHLKTSHPTNLHSIIRRDAKHQVVVKDVKGAVERRYGQLGGPAEVQLVDVDGAVARDGSPVGAVVVASDQRVDIAGWTHDADIRPVGDVDFAR